VKRGLPYELFLGSAISARGHAPNLSLFVWIGVGGVFLGVAALIVVLAVMTGFQDGIRDRIIAANPHLLIFQAGGAGMDAAAVAARVREVPACGRPRRSCSSRRSSPVRRRAHGGLVRGVDLERRLGAATDVPARSGRSTRSPTARRGILLGAELAPLLGVSRRPVTVISPKGALTAVGMVPKMRRSRRAGTVEVGMHEYDSSIAYCRWPPPRSSPASPGVTGVEVEARRSVRRRSGRARRRAALRLPLLDPRLDGHEPQPLRRAPAREARALRDRHDHRAGRGLRHHRPPGAAGGGEAQGDRHPQGDRRLRPSHRAVFFAVGMTIGVVGTCRVRSA
jgi:hypothetical protein